MISARLKKQFPIAENKINFMFSGRVAINVLAKEFKDKGTVLIPEYICNVVDKAFEESGYQIVRYKLKKDFEPDIDNIVKLIDKNSIDILLVASLYGSGKFMDVLNDHTSEIFSKITQQNIQVFIDFAQDFYRIYELDLSYPHYHYIFSFNDKSFMGMMGAMVVSDYDLSDLSYKRLSVKQNIFLFKNYLQKLASCYLPLLITIYRFFRTKGDQNLSEARQGFEFSYCKTFPYTFINYKVSSMQIFFAWIGIVFLNLQLKKKISFIKKYKTNIQQTRYVNTAAYCIWKGDKDIARKYKSPYAKHSDPYSSMYPNLKIYHNKGFCDQ